MKDIRTIRRTVATMANRLHKLGYSLSQAFKTAWKRIKEGMTVKAARSDLWQQAGFTSVHSREKAGGTYHISYFFWGGGSI